MKSIIVVFILMNVFLLFGSNAQTMNMMNMSNMTTHSTSNNTTTRSSATSFSSNINECITMVIVFSYLAQKLFNN
jgi:hypothetical protein